MKIFSWNVNGLRANLNRGTFQSFIDTAKPDILCLQETKMKPDQAALDLPEYEEIWNSAERPGYSGTAVFTKIPPLNQQDNFSTLIQTIYPWDQAPHGNPLGEGRIQTIEFPEFFLVNMYVPNSKPDLSRLNLRHDLWDPAVLQHLKSLNKPVVVCGDFNVAHQPIDLARPQSNTHNAGFTTEERQGMSNYLSGDLIDTFRTLHPDQVQYTWWSHWAHARENNVGWRIDYFLISKTLLPHLKSATIHDQILGSDHCPISIELDFSDDVCYNGKIGS